MRVVITVPWALRAGGAETMLWTFLRHLDRDRVNPVVVFFADGPFASEVSGLGFETIVMPAGRLREAQHAVRTVVRMRRVIEAGCDAILNWTAKSHVYGGTAAVAAGMSRRTIWWQHGVPDGHWLDRVATAIPARAIGCSSHSAAQSQAHLRPRRPTFVVHPGIDDLGLRSGERDDLGLRSGERMDSKLLDPEFLVGIVGRLQPWKGQDRFIEAIADLRRRGHRVRGLVVGGNSHNLSPGYETVLRQLAVESGVAPFITFTGHVDDPADQIKTMDVLVNASRQEPFGIVLLEAMALGVPVMAPAEGGPLEIIEPDRSGVLVKSPSAASLVEGLERVLADPEFRRQLAERGRDRVRARFSADKMCRRLEAALQGVAAG
jgi:glycosyltransferase involved in cell wall biosynthesis